MTTIQIPANGWKIGTCGWLATGLADGSITISPGSSKSGKGGLWIRTPVGSDCLALFNQWDANDARYQKFEVCCDEYGFCSDVPLTDAARSYLSELAAEWCAAANGVNTDASSWSRSGWLSQSEEWNENVHKRN